MWKSGGIVVEYQREDPDNAATNKGGGRSSSNTPAGPARKALASPLVSPRAVSSSGGDGGGVSADQAGSAGRWGGGGGGGAVVTVKVVFSPHQLMHNRACVDQVMNLTVPCVSSPHRCCVTVAPHLFSAVVPLSFPSSVLIAACVYYVMVNGIGFLDVFFYDFSLLVYGVALWACRIKRNLQVFLVTFTKAVRCGVSYPIILLCTP